MVSMKTTTIAPGLVLTEAQYAAAAAGMAAHATLGPLTWGQFTAPTGWWLVPDEAGDAYKAELVLREDAEATVKVNLWLLPDRRSGDGRPTPHSHPWGFSSQILTGGYSEIRYTIHDGQVTVADLEHTQGSTNDVSQRLYHEVTALHTPPGGTMTLMVCGPGARGTWGYLDPDTGRHTPPQPDPRFTAHLNALNPHR